MIRLYLAYHDEEWGVPLHDDRKLFEFLVLEVFQAGLSWRTVLYKRQNFRAAFAGFDYKKVANFDARDLKRLVADAGIIRNRAKIEAAVNNAQRLIEVRKEFGTFAKYMWSWVDGKPIVNRMRSVKDYKPFDDLAVRWSKDLKKRGFKFMGPTVGVRPHAGGGHGERPRGRLLPLPRTAETCAESLATTPQD